MIEALKQSLHRRQSSHLPSAVLEMLGVKNDGHISGIGLTNLETRHSYRFNHGDPRLTQVTLSENIKAGEQSDPVRIVGIENHRSETSAMDHSLAVSSKNKSYPIFKTFSIRALI